MSVNTNMESHIFACPSFIYFYFAFLESLVIYCGGEGQHNGEEEPRNDEHRHNRHEPFFDFVRHENKDE